jgi:hypothetical protein
VDLSITTILAYIVPGIPLFAFLQSSTHTHTHTPAQLVDMARKAIPFRKMENANKVDSPQEHESHPTLVLLPPYRDALEPKDFGESLRGDVMMMSLFDCHVATVDCHLVPFKTYVFNQRDYDLRRQKAAKSMANAASTGVESIRDNNTKRARGEW